MRMPGRTVTVPEAIERMRDVASGAARAQWSDARDREALNILLDELRGAQEDNIALRDELRRVTEQLEDSGEVLRR